MSIWVKETPVEEGWYWMRYKNKRGEITICPGLVCRFLDGGTMVRSAFNDTFFEGPSHGGPGLKCEGKPDKSVRFGPRIESPEKK